MQAAVSNSGSMPRFGVRTMQKFLVFSVLFSVSGLLSGCATLGIGAPPVPSTPATPVFFQEWSAALDQAALSTIASAASVANQEPDAKVVVTGAADTIGSAAANKYLAKTRAQVVADQLVADGVAASRIKVKSIGEVAAPSQAGVPAQFSRRALIQIRG